MYKILHIPTAKYVLTCTYYGYMDSFDYYDEAELFLDKSKYCFSLESDGQPWLAPWNSWTYNHGKIINKEHFEIVEVEGV